MLKIRPEHLSALAEQQASGFVERMRLHVREVFHVEVAGLDDLKLKALIEKICAQGEQWQIIKEPLVERLIELFVSFEQLRRNPPPKWIGDIIAGKGTTGIRVLLMLEKRLQFQEGRTRSAEPSQEAAATTFYRRVDQAFFDEINQKGGALPPDLMDANGNARSLMISAGDRMYRRKWKAIAAEMRRSLAIPQQSIKCASTPWRARASGAKFAPVLLPSKNGATTKVAIVASQEP